MRNTTVSRVLRHLASTKLTLLWMLLLAVGAALSYDNPEDTSIWVLIVRADVAVGGESYLRNH